MKYKLKDTVEIKDHPNKVCGIIKEILEEDIYLVEFIKKDLFPSRLTYKSNQLNLIYNYNGCSHIWNIVKGFSWDFWKCNKCEARRIYDPMNGDKA